MPSNLELPPGFEPNFAMDCKASFFGWPVGRVLSVGRQTVEGNVTTTLAYHFPLDAKGAVATGAIAGDLSTVVAVLFRLLFDTVARSPGRRLCGIVVADRATGRRPRFDRLWRRDLLFALPVGLSFLPVDAALSPASLAEAPSFLIGLTSIPTLLSAALLLWALVSIVRRRPAFYDRPVGTTVLRG